MTKKEWMLENHPDMVCDNFKGGVLGCPSSHRDLRSIDPSAADLNSIGCRQDCTTCWNQEIPGTSNDEIPMPVLGGQFWTFVPLNISQNADLFVMGNFVITALIQDDTIIKVVAKDKILNQTCIFFYNPEKKCIQKLPSDGLLEQKYPEIDFTIYWDEESMNRARRGIISDHEYTNQYILLKKG